MSRRRNSGDDVGFWIAAIVIVWILQYWVWIVVGVVVTALIALIAAALPKIFLSAAEKERRLLERERRLLESVRTELKCLEKLEHMRQMLDSASTQDREILNRTSRK